MFPSKPVAPVEVYPTHEIKQSNVSLKEDIIANPHDYETQTFDFDLQCPNGHFWQAAKPFQYQTEKRSVPNAVNH